MLEEKMGAKSCASVLTYYWTHTQRWCDCSRTRPSCRLQGAKMVEQKAKDNKKLIKKPAGGKKIRTRWNTKHTKTKTNQIKRRELRRRRRWNTRNKQTGGWSGTGDIIRTINKRQRQKRQTWNMRRNLTEQKTWNRIQTSWQTLTNCQEQLET